MSFTIHVLKGGFAPCFSLYAQNFLKFFSGLDDGLGHILMGHALRRSNGLHAHFLHAQQPKAAELFLCQAGKSARVSRTGPVTLM